MSRSSNKSETPLTSAISGLTEVLSSYAEGKSDRPALASAISAAVQAAESNRLRTDGWQTEFTLTIGQVIARRIKELREEAEWTQVNLAGAMQAIGFTGWKRLTVVEVEGCARKVSYEELLAVAALFAVPMVDLLSPPEGIVIELPRSRNLDAGAVRDLVAGSPGDPMAHASWPTPSRVWAGVGAIQRPAEDLWARRAEPRRSQSDGGN